MPATGHRRTPAIRWWHQCVPVWRCAWPIPAAGLAGAAIDQWHHAGFSIWLKLCQSLVTDPFGLLLLQVQLMPVMLVAMLTAMAWQWLYHPSRYGPLMLALCQSGCLAAMPVTAGLCAALATMPGSDGARLLAMGLLDGGMGLAAATLFTIPVTVSRCPRQRVSPA
jgi:hypothetical protein